MNPEQIFSLCNGIAVVGWASLILAPRKRFSTLTAGLAIPVLLGGAYAVLIALNWRGSSGGFNTLHDVTELFSHQWLLLAGWIHYLAFDLVVGTWEVRDAHASGVPHPLLVPCLLLTFFFGPAGLLTYLILRALKSPARFVAP
jgi:hypothetical protein